VTGEALLRAASFLEASEGLDPWTALMRVLISRLETEPVPQPLLQVLAVAQRHWAGELSDLADARVAVWRFIERIGPSGADLEVPEGKMARALLCVLNTEGDDEARSMTAEWFSSMLAS
jgi:hypothetical protein